MESTAESLNFNIFGFGKPAQEAKMVALALCEGRFIFTARWGEMDSFRTLIYQELRSLKKQYGGGSVCAYQITPKLYCVVRGLTPPEAKAKLRSYMTPERLNDLATNAEARYRSPSVAAPREGYDVDGNERAGKV